MTTRTDVDGLNPQQLAEYLKHQREQKKAAQRAWYIRNAERIQRRRRLAAALLALYESGRFCLECRYLLAPIEDRYDGCEC